MCDADSVTIATVVIAIATVANVFVALYQWIAARKSANIAKMIFEAGNRPYVGVDLLGCQKNESKRCLDIQVNIKNFGTALAENCEARWVIYVDGIKLEGLGFSANPAVLFPGSTLMLHARLVEPKCSAIIDGKSSLEIAVNYSYRWQPDKSHIYKERYRYEHTQERFMTLGVEQTDKPNS